MKTGDIGRLDANGDLSMLDRADDVVSVRRKNWSSSVPFIKTPVGKTECTELREPFWVARERRDAGKRRTCAARLRERVKRCAQFTFCVGCYVTVVLRALSV